MRDHRSPPSTSPIPTAEPAISSQTQAIDRPVPEPPDTARRHLRVVLLRLAAVAAALGALLLAWTVLAQRSSPDILPGPAAVWSRFQESLSDGTYLPSLRATVEEAAIGWFVAAIVALPLGYAVGRVRPLEDALAPYLAGSQAMPVVAIAPLLIVWVGFGLLPKVIVSSLIAFFPILATTAGGVRSVASDLRDAARAFGAGWLSMALYVDLPLAARTVFAGLKVGAALAVTGAVVGEFTNPDRGLGQLMLSGSYNNDTPLMFVALVSLVGLGALAYTAVSLVERLVIQWDD